MSEQAITVRCWANLGDKDNPVFRAVSDEPLAQDQKVYIPVSSGGVSIVRIDGEGQWLEFRGNDRLKVPAGSYWHYPTRKDEDQPKPAPKRKAAPKSEDKAPEKAPESVQETVSAIQASDSGLTPEQKLTAIHELCTAVLAIVNS